MEGQTVSAETYLEMRNQLGLLTESFMSSGGMSFNKSYTAPFGLTPAILESVIKNNFLSYCLLKRHVTLFPTSRVLSTEFKLRYFVCYFTTEFTWRGMSVHRDTGCDVFTVQILYSCWNDFQGQIHIALI